MTTSQLETLRNTLNTALEQVSGIISLKPAEPEWKLTNELPGFRPLRDGEEWHRQDFIKEMLEGGWRPCLVGEKGYYQVLVLGKWVDGNWPEAPTPKGASDFLRTKRPLPILSASQIADGWKEHTGGENPAPGRRVHMFYNDGSVSDFGHFSDTIEWQNIIAYRIIEPCLVPLGPEDVPPGSVFRLIERSSEISPWALPFAVNHSVVYFPNNETAGTATRTWEYLRDKAEINRSLSLGKWDATAWQPCSKEAAQ